MAKRVCIDSARRISNDKLVIEVTSSDVTFHAFVDGSRDEFRISKADLKGLILVAQ